MSNSFIKFKTDSYTEIVRPGFLYGADTRIDLLPIQSKKT